MNKIFPYIAFVAITLLCGFGIASLAPPGDWYANLNKPSFNPPNSIFGPVWTILYIMIGIAGGAVWSNGRDKTALTLWVVQLILNMAWSLLFFTFHKPGLALIDIVLLLITIVAFIMVTKVPLARWMFVPYLLWISFATVLNIAIVVLN